MAFRGKIVKSKSLSDLALVVPIDENVTTYSFELDSIEGGRKSWKLKLIGMIDTIEGRCFRAPNEIKKCLVPLLLQKNISQLLFYSMATTLGLFYIYTYVHHHYHGNMQYADAYDQSFGLFRYINNEHWKTLKEYYHSSNPHKFGDVDTFIDDPNVWYQYNWNKNFVCPEEERIGINPDSGSGEIGDGPKWVCNVRDIVRVVNDRMNPKSLEWAKDTFGKVSGMKAKRADNGCLVYSIGVNAMHLGFEMGLQQMLTREAEKAIDGYEMGKPFDTCLRS